MAKFVKGQSGNPGGRPSGLGDIREIARQHTDAAIEVLVSVMGNESASHAAKVSAAVALLDRGWGKPEQSLRASIDGEMSLSNVLREISERRKVALVSVPQLLLTTSTEQAN